MTRWLPSVGAFVELQLANVGEELVIQLNAEDPEGLPVLYSIEENDLIAEEELNTATGEIRFTPDSVGDYLITVIAMDSSGISSERSFEVSVS